MSLKHNLSHQLAPDLVNNDVIFGKFLGQKREGVAIELIDRRGDDIIDAVRDESGERIGRGRSKFIDNLRSGIETRFPVYIRIGKFGLRSNDHLSVRRPNNAEIEIAVK